MIYPVTNGRVTNKFSRAHPGTDYAPKKAGDTKTPCLAPETSTVVAAGVGKVEGNYVILQGLKTGKFYYFGHFSVLKVKKGRGVSEGTVIGILGKTGKATGIHAHCEVRDERNSSFSGKHDPEKWFKAHVKGENMDVKETKEYKALAALAEKYKAQRDALRAERSKIVALANQYKKQRDGLRVTIKTYKDKLINFIKGV